MTTNTPFGMPDFIFESAELAQKFRNKTLKASELRGNDAAQEGILNGDINKDFVNGAQGLAFYFSHTAPQEDSSPIAFERHFNPQMRFDSSYFSALSNLTRCVEKNVDSTDASVCANEFKALRKTAFEGELFYHNINKRFYMSQLQVQRHEAPY